MPQLDQEVPATEEGEAADQHEQPGEEPEPLRQTDAGLEGQDQGQGGTSLEQTLSKKSWSLASEPCVVLSHPGSSGATLQEVLSPNPQAAQFRGRGH